MFWYLAQKIRERPYKHNSSHQVIKLFMQRWKECKNNKAPNRICKALLGCLALLHFRGLEISINQGDGKRSSPTDCDRSMLNLCYKVARVLPGFGHQKLYSELSLMQKGLQIYSQLGTKFKMLCFLFSLGWGRGRQLLMIILKKQSSKAFFRRLIQQFVCYWHWR